jgi:thiol:disulfide interchange protein
MKLLLVIILLLMHASSSFAETILAPAITSDISTASIIAEKNAVQQGEKLWVALRIQLGDGWHSYANPSGDSGYATKIALKLPDGVQASPIYWQEATPFYTDDILSYGYANEVYHFIAIDIPKDYAGEELAFEARAEWLVCKDICIPESGKWQVSIPIGEAQVDADFSAKRMNATPNEAIIKQPNTPIAKPNDFNIMLALISAFIGGLVLNLMPCVLPILSLKTLSLVKIAGKSRRLSALHGVSYTCGTIAGFIALALIIIALKASGTAVGWGFQLQSPTIIALLALLMLIIALNLSDVFELPAIGGGFQTGSGLSASFFTGLLAVSVATPCTAPFMAGAVGFAITQSTIAQIAIFAALGLGLASPYLLISLVPKLQKCLPKSGAWTLHFKHFLAFPMYAAAAWLAWVLARQAGDFALATLFTGALITASLLWLIGKLYGRKLLKTALFITLLITIFLTITSVATPMIASYLAKISQPYSPAKLQKLQSDGQKIFIYATADWCITCKLNEKLVLSDDAIGSHFTAQNIAVLKADFTNHDADIAKLLSSNGLAGVPAYLYYDGVANQTQVLPNLLRNSDILELK